MLKWTVKVTKYKGQIKVVVPKELASLAGLNRCEYVEMNMDSTGKIIMGVLNARGNRKVES